MTTYTIPAPDGKMYSVEGPEGASKDEVIAEVLRQNPQAGKAPVIEQEPPKVVSASPMSFGETGGGAAMGRPVNRGQLNIQAQPRPLESAMAGATRSFVDPLIAGAQLATNNAPRINELVQRLAKESGEYQEANPTSYGTGRVAGAVLPAIGMSRGIGMIPSFGKNPYVSGAVIGTGTGAISGALQPIEGGQTGPKLYEEAGKNARTGALIGGPVGAIAPVVGQVVDKGYRAGKAIVEPFLESGKEKILGRFLREMSGGEEAKAMRNLRNPQQFVEGSQPTAAQVAGVPSLAALERTAIATSPTAGNLMAQRQAQNAQAQANALRNIAPETRISKYTNLRERVADDLYTDALKPLSLGTLDDKTTAEISNLIKRPAIKNAMEAAKENAANRGMDIADPAGSMRGLHETKMALDRQIKTVKAKLDRDNAGASSSELDGLINAKTNLLSFMEKISPSYKSARISYDRLSKPIEQLESIQKLAGKTISSEAERIKGVTDFSNKLEELKKAGVISDRQVARLEAIKQDLARGKFAAEAGKGVGSDTVQKLAYSNLMNQTGLPISASNRLGRVVYGDVNEELKNKLAESMLSPQETLRLMRLGREPKISPDQKTRNDLARLLTIQGLQNTVQGASNE
jgi:hypothetical protein